MSTLGAVLKSNRFIAGVLVVLLVLSLIPTKGGYLLETALMKAGLDRLDQTAEGYLRDQREKAFQGFLLLSGIKVALALLKGSELGFGVHVKIGNLAVAAYDYVDFGWKVLLAATAYFYFAEFFLQAVETLDVAFLWAALAFFVLAAAAGMALPEWYRTRWYLRRTGRIAAVLALVFYLGFPMVFVGGGWVSGAITGNSIDDANRVYGQIEDALPNLLGPGTAGQGEPEGGGQPSGSATPGSVTVPFTLPGGTSSGTFKTSGDRRAEAAFEGSLLIGDGESLPPIWGAIKSGILSLEKLGNFRDYIAGKTSALAASIFQQAAAYFFNIVAFPVISLLGLYWLARYLITANILLPGRKPGNRGD